MRRFLVAATGVLLSASGAHAQTGADTWQATMVLDKARSPGGCRASFGDVTLEIAGRVLGGTTANGRLFTADIGPGGAVAQDFQSATGRRGRVTGSATSRVLQVELSDSGCLYNLMPRK